MDNPAAGAAGALKRVPKWAWIAGAGISGGVIFYRYTHKSTPDTAPTGDATSPADYGQTYSPLGTVTSTPVSSGDSSGGPVVVPQGLALSDVTDLLGVIHQNDPIPAPPVSATDLLNAVLPYVGGGAPQSTTTQQAPPDPVYAPTPPPPPAPPRDLCTGAFPNDAGGGDCYRVQCNPPGHAKGRWHFHKNGASARVSATC